VVVLALSTGMRRGEIMSLRWPQIDLVNGRILLFATKNDTSRAIPLAGKALTMMADLAKVRRIDTDLVFYGR
jgi:integrase